MKLLSICFYKDKCSSLDSSNFKIILRDKGKLNQRLTDMTCDKC
jgi:hypothetical protein